MNVFVARQPILDRRGKLFAYELLFREGVNNYFNSANGDQATGRLISNSFFNMGLEQITGGKKAFVNFTSNFLKKDFAVLLSCNSVVIEILENVEPDLEIIEACKKLKKLNYVLALDDFELTPAVLPLIEYADIIKVDFQTTNTEQRRKLIQQFGGRVKFLAEKVETIEDHQEALHMGYQYFQGYYFSKPVIIQGTDIPLSKMNSLRLLKEVYNQEFSVDHIDQIIKSDVTLSYKLLKFINSSAFGFKSKISSIRQALILLGPQELKKWVSIMILGHIGEEKPHELIVQSYIRATFAEAVAQEIGLKDKSSDAFLMGLFSLVDAVLDCSFEKICKELPLTDSIKQALKGTQNLHRNILDLVIYYERGNWTDLGFCVKKLNLPQEKIPVLYFKSLDKANRFLAEGVS